MEKMTEEYKDALCLLCRQSAVVEQMRKLKLSGEELDPDAITYHLQLLEKAKELLVEIKGELGYKDGLRFMENANFYRFRLKDGCLEGDYSYLPEIVLPWIETEEDPFRYEVGVLLLSHYFMQRGEYSYGMESLVKNMPLFVRVKRFVDNLLITVSELLTGKIGMFGKIKGGFKIGK